MLEPKGNISGSVKWIDPGKGYGIIKTAGDDVFFHCSVVPDDQHIRPGTAIRADIAERERGLIVTAFTKIEHGDPPSDDMIMGVVDWFNRAKKMGIILTMQGEAVIHNRTMARCGVITLRPRMKVLVRLAPDGNELHVTEIAYRT